MAAKMFKKPVFGRGATSPFASPDSEEMDASLLNNDEKYWTWMHVPEAREGCPDGLECFQDTEELWVCQHKSLKDELKVVDAKCRFSIKDGEKQVIFFAEEKSRAEDRVCWGKDREFTLVAKDESLQDIVSFHRPWKSKAAFFSWLNTEKTGWTLEVAVKGKPLGAIRQVNSGFHKRFDLVDDQNRTLLHIKGPFFEGRLFTEDVDFDLFQADRKTPAGKIALKWCGLKKDLIDSQQFKIKTDSSVTATGRILAVGATFLIRFMCTSNC